MLLNMAGTLETFQPNEGYINSFLQHNAQPWWHGLNSTSADVLFERFFSRKKITQEISLLPQDGSSERVVDIYFRSLALGVFGMNEWARSRLGEPRTILEGDTVDAFLRKGFGIPEELVPSYVLPDGIGLQQGSRGEKTRVRSWQVVVPEIHNYEEHIEAVRELFRQQREMYPLCYPAPRLYCILPSQTLSKEESEFIKANGIFLVFIDFMRDDVTRRLQEFERSDSGQPKIQINQPEPMVDLPVVPPGFTLFEGDVVRIEDMQLIKAIRSAGGNGIDGETKRIRSHKGSRRPWKDD